MDTSAAALQGLDWQICRTDYDGPGRYRAGDEWRPAAVPGAVQVDMSLGTDYEDPFYGENWQQYRWMESEHFLYRAAFSDPRTEAGQVCRFVCGGIDYRFEITLNGNVLLTQEGMFKPVDLILDEYLAAENTLEVLIFPSPTGGFTEPDRRQASRSVKPAVSYSWDWHPRLVPAGIWEEAGLVVVPASHLAKADWQVGLNESLGEGRLICTVEGRALAGCLLAVEVEDPQGEVVLTDELTLDGDRVAWTGSVDSPALWWPHDHGDQPLYTAALRLLSADGKELDARSRRLGFRRVQLLMNEGAWAEPSGFPKGRSTAPIALTVNGRRIFSKGSNWVNPEIFPGRITRETYAPLLELARDAHFNLLRVWGGGIVNKESFHELCDEMGLMVWQEFPLACNEYPDDDDYLAVLESEARAILTRLRSHPSTVLWCGGNELFNNWSGMTDQAKPLRLLNGLCYEMDQDTPFLMTSPVFGMAHGHYVLREDWGDSELFSWMQKAKNTAYTEYGVSGPADVDILESIIPEDELWPPEPGTSWESHHAFGAWTGDTWLRKTMIEHYFGPSEDLATLVERGQYLQGVGLRFIYEEARRQQPYCSMALNWCFCEPWPTAANSSIVSYPHRPKPAYAQVRDACRPVALAARFDKLVWQTGECFEFDLHLLSDLYETVEAGTAVIEISQGNRVVPVLTWEHLALAPNTNLAGPRCRVVLPAWETGRFTLALKHREDPARSAEYELILRRSAQHEEGLRALNQ
jgi:beta-mannosidase